MLAGGVVHRSRFAVEHHKRNVTCSKVCSGGDQIGTICCKVHNRVDSSWSTLERDLITTACVWTCTAVAPLACALRLVER